MSETFTVTMLNTRCCRRQSWKLQLESFDSGLSHICLHSFSCFYVNLTVKPIPAVFHVLQVPSVAGTNLENSPTGFIKGRVPEKLTSCEDDFACLVWPFRGKVFLWRSSYQKVLPSCENQLLFCWKCQWNPWKLQLEIFESWLDAHLFPLKVKGKLNFI